MIYFTILSALFFCFYARVKLKWKLIDGEYDDLSAFGFLFLIIFLISALLTIFVIARVDGINSLKSQNINMIPTSVLEDIYNEKVIQLQKVQDKIQQSFDKNQFQVQINSLNGLQIYTMPMSGAGVGFQGLGDVEKGGAEKLKLLETLIEKQNIIAEELVKAKQDIARPDYYKRNAEIMTMENSIFDGWIIKWLSISNNVDSCIIQKITIKATNII